MYEASNDEASNADAIRAVWVAKKKPRVSRAFLCVPRVEDTASPPLMAALFPVMMNAHLVAFVMMRISLSGSDRAQSNDGCGNGENNLLHYKTLKSMLWSNQCSTGRTASARKHATSRGQIQVRRVHPCVDATRKTL
jgi:hypothetical protein